MIGCRLTTPDTLDIVTNPPSRLLAWNTEDSSAESHPPLRSYFRWAVLGRSTPGYSPVRRLSLHPPGGRSFRRAPQASFRPRPGPHPGTHKPPGTSPIFVSDSSLDSVRSLLTEDHSQMLGYLRFSAKLEGQSLRGVGVDDAQLGLLGVEDEHGVQIAVLDCVAKSPEVQPFVSLSPPHLVHRATLAS